MTQAGPRLAVITGASAGIGLELSRLVARGGRPVLAVARRSGPLEELSLEAGAGGWAPIYPLALDISSPSAAASILSEAEALGGAEWLVNNAGFGLYGPLVEAEPGRLAEMVRLNCESVVLLTRAFLPALLRRGDGFILNVASVAGFVPVPFEAVYGATKAFVLSFTEALAEELKGTPLGAGAFCPGPVATEFQRVSGAKRRSPGALTAEAAAREALLQIGAREVLRVPRLPYRLAMGISKLVPRSVTRRMAGRWNRPPETGRTGRPDGSAR